MTFEVVEKKILSSDGKNTLSGVMYIPNEEIKGIFHLVHGMTEYIDRYAPLLTTLAEKGYLCVGYDHLGHGHTAAADDLGFIASKDGDKLLVDDVKLFADSIKAEYPNIPYYLMGHSMGSFITRLAVSKHKDLADKYICCGTAGKNSAADMGLLLCKTVRLFKGERAVSPLLEGIAFGAYNKRFEQLSKYDWLTKDRKVINKYANDSLCTFSFTVSAMHDLISLIKNCNSKKWFEAVSPNLPILLIAGDMDPVGNYGKGVREVYNRLMAAQKDASIILYQNCRHEIHNDSCKEQMTCDILKFIEE